MADLPVTNIETLTKGGDGAICPLFIRTIRILLTNSDVFDNFENFTEYVRRELGRNYTILSGSGKAYIFFGTPANPFFHVNNLFYDPTRDKLVTMNTGGSEQSNPTIFGNTIIRLRLIMK